jgi:hypothetical protein
VPECYRGISDDAIARLEGLFASTSHRGKDDYSDGTEMLREQKVPSNGPPVFGPETDS